MKYFYGWMPDLAWDGGDEERWVLESEVEMQMWRWALLEAHLRGASLVYESLMGSPLAPTAQGERVHPAPDEGPPIDEGDNSVPPRRSSGRSQGRRQRRRFLQHQKRGSRLPRPGRGMEQTQE